MVQLTGLDYGLYSITAACDTQPQRLYIVRSWNYDPGVVLPAVKKSSTFSTKKYVVDIQNNRLNETVVEAVLLST